MTPNEAERRAAELPEILLHRKVKEIMAADGIPYIEALEAAWYDPANAALVDSCRAVVGDDEDPEGDGPMLPVDAGIEIDKRVRGCMSEHPMTHEAALNAVLAADAALRTAWDADLNLGAD